MLSDDARKILTVVWHMHRYNWADYLKAMQAICKRSGRSEQRVRGALNELIQLGYLEHKDGLTRVLWPSQLEREKHERQAWMKRN